MARYHRKHKKSRIRYSKRRRRAIRTVCTVCQGTYPPGKMTPAKYVQHVVKYHTAKIYSNG